MDTEDEGSEEHSDEDEIGPDEESTIKECENVNLVEETENTHNIVAEKDDLEVEANIGSDTDAEIESSGEEDEEVYNSDVKIKTRKRIVVPDDSDEETPLKLTNLGIISA